MPMGMQNKLALRSPGGQDHVPPPVKLGRSGRAALQTICRIVPPGLRRAAAADTNRPVVAERYTGLALRVPRPTRSLVVVRADRVAAPLDANRPLPA